MSSAQASRSKMTRWSDFVDAHPWLEGGLNRARALLPPLNFITIHYAYFVVVCLITSVIFWGSSKPAQSIGYADSLFLVVSAMTEAGLNTVNLSQMTAWQQVLLFLLIIFGSSIWVSIWTVLFRKRVFEQRFKDIVKAHGARKPRSPSSQRGLPLLRRSFQKVHDSNTIPGSKVPPPDLETTPNEKGGKHFPPDSSASHQPSDRESRAETPVSPPGVQEGGLTVGSAHIAFADRELPGGNAHSSSVAHPSGVQPTRRNAAATGSEETEKQGHTSFASKFTVDRNGQFHDLSSEEREHLGGCEYRALKILSILVPLYFFLWQFLGCIALGAWINNKQPDAALTNAINPWWAGIFIGASAFNNSGMSLLDANMIPFEQSPFVLIVAGLLILAGNTAYPLILRLSVWSILRLLQWMTIKEDYGETKATLEFILKYPRRVYTNLFPSRQTWWLLFMVMMLNCIDWAGFEVLNIGNSKIETIPRGYRVLDGLFQALAVRSGGFYVVPIPNIYIGLQVLYVIMMYISVYPVVITMRHSNVYEERSLGIYAEDSDVTSDLEHASQLSQPATSAEATPQPASLLRRLSGFGPAPRVHRAGTVIEMGGAALRRTIPHWQGVGVPRPVQGESGAESPINFISQQIQGQMAHDLWWLVIAVLVITTIETSHFLEDPVNYSVFNVIFEVVSAYGCVGISTGLPDQAYSFSGGWHVGSKLVLCLVMLRGRHRGLPVALDRAVRLPGEQLHRDEEEDYRIRRRSMTMRRSFG